MMTAASATDRMGCETMVSAGMAGSQLAAGKMLAGATYQPAAVMVGATYLRHMYDRDQLRADLAAPRYRRFKAEAYCLLLSMVPHKGNHYGRTLATMALLLVWASIEIGAAFDYAELPDQFFFLRLVVGVVIGRMWGIEINNVAGVEIGYRTDNGDGGDDDS